MMPNRLREQLDNALGRAALAKDLFEIGKICAEVEALIAKTQTAGEQSEISATLKRLEEMYEKDLKQSEDYDWLDLMTPEWCELNIASTKKILQDLRFIAPTERTKSLYIAHAERYIEKVTKIRDEKTPGHPAWKAKIEAEEHLRLSFIQAEISRRGQRGESGQRFFDVVRVGKGSDGAPCAEHYVLQVDIPKHEKEGCCCL